MPSSPPEADDGEKTITEVTRREIVDALVTATNGGWSGRLQEDDFLSRLYDLESLPSDDGRYKTAAGDIWKHRVMNTDWDDHWVFHDSRFRIFRAPDEEFLRFLCETVHPVVRPDSDAARVLVAQFNEELARDGWEIYEHKQLSGRPVFAARKAGTRVAIFDEPTGWPKVDRQMDEVRSRLHEASTEEQFQAVGLLCRETLISLAQAVYDAERYPSTNGVAASATDAKRMLEAFIAVELSGPANEEIRSHAKAALRVALALQHDRSADFRAAALCAEGTASMVNLIGILSGARTPKPR
jgi:hypothetical protein